MLKQLIKYIILDKAIEILFQNITKNFSKDMKRTVSGKYIKEHPDEFPVGKMIPVYAIDSIYNVTRGEYIKLNENTNTKIIDIFITSHGKYVVGIAIAITYILYSNGQQHRLYITENDVITL